MLATRREFVTGTGALLSTAATSRQAFAAAMVVNYDVAPIHQGADANLCWAAASAMLLNWPVPGLHTMQSVAQLGGTEFVDLLKTKAAITPDAKARLYQNLHLKVETGFSPTIAGWYKLLESKGPLHVTILTNESQGMLHGVLLTGLVGDGSAANTTVYYNDPATGTKKTAAAVDFMQMYDGAASWANNIIHQP